MPNLSTFLFAMRMGDIVSNQKGTRRFEEVKELLIGLRIVDITDVGRVSRRHVSNSTPTLNVDYQQNLPVGAFDKVLRTP